MGWLSTATPNPSPSTAGCQGARCCQSREGSIPWDISVQSPKMQQKKGCSEATTSRRDPHSHLLWGITWLPGHQHLHCPMEELWTPHPYPHPTYAHTHTPLFSPYPIQNKAALTPGAPRASCSPPKPPSPAVPELTCSQAALFVCPRYLQPGAPALIPSAR